MNTTTNKSPSATQPDEIVAAPWTHYASPDALLASAELTTEQKRKALKSWELDELQKLKATEENMPGGPKKNLLHEVRRCLRSLG